jgi:hypothetical protein
MKEPFKPRSNTTIQRPVDAIRAAIGRWIERHDGTRTAGFYLERRGTRQRAALWRIRRYDQHQRNEPSWPENNSPNSQNSLSMSVEAQLATLRTPVANDEPVAVTLRASR